MKKNFLAVILLLVLFFSVPLHVEAASCPHNNLYYLETEDMNFSGCGVHSYPCITKTYYTVTYCEDCRQPLSIVKTRIVHTPL